MKITPLDIYNKEFRKKFSLWAYDGKEVDEFLDHVAASYEKLLKEMKQLKEENEQLRSELSKYQEMERTLQETMVVAQETVKERKEQAEREAELIIETAKNKAREIMAEAKEKVKERMRQFRQLEEYEQFFRIRLKSLIDSHLQLLNESQIERPEEIETLKKELAVSYEDTTDDEVESWGNVKTEESQPGE
ncbi:hypothetical protein BBF96_06175 [Anoxybacter fermentans]|uniref:Septum formation initiator n=1 Tax=Anoxybacter fermentans TaxID=1323375 RepID=A0A3S9SXJ6_9FIRM|nr:DivIVA domain-containing protein [Anoxybacter fermentans]AZR73019.1 hypothetical protein BBF96_06175 [Anoxybacter fermentans]